MSMMYRIIADALQKAGLSDKYHPQDYLNFYCLGKREPEPLECPLPANHRTTENRALVYLTTLPFIINRENVWIACSY